MEKTAYPDRKAHQAKKDHRAHLECRDREDRPVNQEHLYPVIDLQLDHQANLEDPDCPASLVILVHLERMEVKIVKMQKN